MKKVAAGGGAAEAGPRRSEERVLSYTPQIEESEGLRAVCHQHEIDQLDGIFWIRRLSRLKRERLIKRFDKMSRN